MPRSRSRADQPFSLRITDYSDRELLALARDLQNGEGHIDTTAVAQQIWPTRARGDALLNARACVSLRFSWMRRYGVLDKVEGQQGIWQLTEFGEEFVNGSVNAAQERAIAGSRPGQELELMALMGDLYEKVDEDAATLMRREFQFRAYRRRWGS
jgi:hypothetical protein